MTKRSTSRSSFIRMALFALAFGVVAPAQAAAIDGLPPERSQGAISYRSGGIGDDEARAMKQAAGGYALAVMFVERQPDGSAAYGAGDRLIITDPLGQGILDTVANGPFLLAQLPQGRYVVKAWRGRSGKEQAVDIVPGQTRHITFSW